MTDRSLLLMSALSRLVGQCEAASLALAQAGSNAGLVSQVSKMLAEAASTALKAADDVVGDRT